LHRVPGCKFELIGRSDVRSDSSNISQSGAADPPAVLLVEDDEPLRVVLHDGLKDGGFDVLVVASAKEALALLRSGVALITDIKLADGQEGWDVARQAREIDSSLPPVPPAADWRAQGVPNSIFLRKPFAPAQLLTAVSQLLKRSRLGLKNRARPALDRAMETPPVTTLAKLLSQKQQLIERLEEGPGPHEREEIERLLAEIEEELSLLDEAGPGTSQTDE